MDKLYVTSTDSTITLYWDKPDGAAKEQTYTVYADGAQIAQVSRTHYTLEGLTPEKEVSFSVTCEIGVVAAGVGVGAEVLDFIAHLFQVGDQFVLQSQSAVVTAKCNFHRYVLQISIF